MNDIVVRVLVDDMVALSQTAREVQSLVASIGKGEVVDATAVTAANGLLLAMLHRLSTMHKGPAHYWDI